MAQKSAPSVPAPFRVLLALLLPFLGGALASLVAGGMVNIGHEDQGQTAVFLAGVGLVSWFMSLFWYGLRSAGLRGGRPLYAGIGFSVLAWVTFLLVRLSTVEAASVGSPDSGQAYLYLLLFEAFCVQLWVFGLFFRSVADWRGPLAAAFASGVLFGAFGVFFFQESFAVTGVSLAYFVAWGVLYGIIRLRTGSLLGVTVVQSLHSWTAWVLLPPTDLLAFTQLRNMYFVSIIFYLILVWRLWPRQEEDYRI
jgi:hypothetical protein